MAASESRKQLLAMANAMVPQLYSHPLKVGRDAPDLQRFTIFSSVSESQRQEFLSLAVQDPVIERAMGSLCGMAVADAVGAPLEFIGVCEPGHSFDPETMKYVGTFNKFQLKRGQWTDDCSMGLCMADSLILKQQYDGSDIRVRFWNWWNCNYNNAFRKDLQRDGSVGLGGNISKSLMDVRHDHPPPRYEASTEDSGNGSLMRLAPMPVFFHQNLEKAASFSCESNYTTHPGPIAAEMCGFVGFVIARALNRSAAGQTAAAFLEECADQYGKYMKLTDAELSNNRAPGGHERARNVLARMLRGAEPAGSTEQCWSWRDPKGPFLGETMRARGNEYNGFPNSAGYFGSYSADGLALALHCVYHTGSFMAAISKCVNFLGDADSTGSITGQIAGAFYGYNQIDPRCIANLETWDDREVALRGALLCVLGREAVPS